MKVEIWLPTILTFVLINCSRGPSGRPETQAERLCTPTQLIGKYGRGFSLGSIYTLTLDSSGEFRYGTFSDGAETYKQTWGIYKISDCIIELSPEKFEGQENYMVILSRRLLAYSPDKDVYLVPMEDTAAFLAAAKKGKASLNHLVTENVFKKENEEASR